MELLIQRQAVELADMRALMQETHKTMMETHEAVVPGQLIKSVAEMIIMALQARKGTAENGRDHTAAVHPAESEAQAPQSTQTDSRDGHMRLHCVHSGQQNAQIGQELTKSESAEGGASDPQGESLPQDAESDGNAELEQLTGVNASATQFGNNNSDAESWEPEPYNHAIHSEETSGVDSSWSNPSPPESLGFPTNISRFPPRSGDARAVKQSGPQCISQAPLQNPLPSFYTYGPVHRVACHPAAYHPGMQPDGSYSMQTAFNGSQGRGMHNVPMSAAAPSGQMGSAMSETMGPAIRGVTMGAAMGGGTTFIPFQPPHPPLRGKTQSYAYLLSKTIPKDTDKEFMPPAYYATSQASAFKQQRKQTRLETGAIPRKNMSEGFVYTKDTEEAGTSHIESSGGSAPHSESVLQINNVNGEASNPLSPQLVFPSIQFQPRPMDPIKCIAAFSPEIAQIKNASGRPQSKGIFDVNGVTLDDSDLKILTDRKQLVNSGIIQGYAKLVSLRNACLHSEKSDWIIFEPFIATSILKGNLRKATQEFVVERISSAIKPCTNFLFFPTNIVDSHWCSIVVDMIKREVIAFETIQKDRYGILKLFESTMKVYTFTL